ncbi:cysteine proteinase [Yamadazyma tenuis ATCC 10573]|uniref:Cysteine proteinase n=2 Tax=Candida tenuis TaxID=2315449 RepID=G3B5P2_CANTC|nr:cysteine proteinase [Yamadazyma tenuis ATCC 10573]EGV63277.1 cysteine proteinase [Yamadazyma tenuis ATCC 10573]
MFTKRPDKYTTGLINMRNDCFANSSLQAYSSLPGLTEYLNKFILSFHDLTTFIEDNQIDIDQIPDALPESNNPSNPKFKKMEAKFEVPLHISLAKILKKLQATQLTTRTISVWTFLHDLEKIFDAKISRSQHDAHELTQLISETLENEYLKVTKKFKNLLNNLSSKSHKHIGVVKLIEFPDFPLNGLILTQMKCFNCKGVSKPKFSQFLMLTLHTPETISTDLESLLNENESESIDGYQCLKCRVKYIVNNENYSKAENRSNLAAEEEILVKELTKLNDNPSFCINDDLPEYLENYIKTYKKNNVDISKITSTVLRKNQILKPPKIFGLHLSRSSFNGFNVTRNSCRVSFRDHLNLSIGKEYSEDLKHFQLAAQDSFFINEDTSKSKVLTTDVDDMEDEAVQREDVEESGDHDSESEDHEDEDAIAADQTESDVDSVISTHTISQAIASSKSSASSATVKTPESLNNSPITTDQTDDLINHFKKFKFNENDVYKYRLKAMIRHQGSHTQGHYECYKRKPLFVKDKDGMIIKLSPEILDEAIETEEETHEPPASTKFRRASMISASSTEIDAPSSESQRTYSSSSDRADIMASLNEDNIPEPPGTFRRKFSNMMGRRPSVFQADPEDVRIEEIIPSGLTTPAEIIVQEMDSDYFSSELTDQVNAKLKTKDHHQDSGNGVKLKKIPSLLKNPYWRISDSLITEVSKAAVLCETTSVYMLYYERVEK